MQTQILIINGPNLNLLGKREPHIYGNLDFETFIDGLRKEFNNVHVDYFQSNIEGELIDRLQAADGKYAGVIMNAASYSHTSIGIADCIAAITTPVVEVHISNVYSRESFRHTMITAGVCKGVISGLGLAGYRLALIHLLG